MKKIKILACFIGALALGSCDNFLSELPDDRTQLDSKEKIQELLVFSYPHLAPNTFLEAMSDNVTDNDVLTMHTRENVNYYNWEDSEMTQQDSPAGYWDGCYGAISQSNEALKGIEEMGDTPDLRAIKGEALLSRAFAHFMLVNIWGKAYNPATSGSDLGVPYVKEPELELIKHYKRNTVQEVYDFIEADLLEGLENIVDGGYNETVKKFHFSPASARAFAVKFYLHKGDWDKVLEYSSSLGSKPTNKLKNYVYANSLPLDASIQYYASTDQETNLLVNTVPSGYRRTFAYDRFSSSTVFLNDLLSQQNNYFGKRFIYQTSYLGNRDNSNVSKNFEYFKVTNPTAQTGYAYGQFVLLSNDEMYLARIEALAMTGRIDEAVSELGHFVGQRTTGYNPSTDILTYANLASRFPDASSLYTPFYSLTTEQAVVVQAIAEARRRDLIHEGNRWFDIKRFDLEVRHRIGKEYVVLAKGDERRAFQIPKHVLDSGLQANPR